MTDTDNELPSPREALRQAYLRLLRGDHEPADTWISLAREIRHGSTPRRSAEQALTLHDVEGIVCVHGTVAVRRSGGPGSWFLHTNDGTTCDGPANQHETDWMRRRATQASDSAEPKVEPVVEGDRMAGYVAGQVAPPTYAAYGYALEIARAIMSGESLPEGIPRDLAHQLALEIIDRGADLYDPQRVIGSASPATTLSDLRESETTKLLDTSRLRGRDLANGLDATAVLRAQSSVGPPTCRNADGLEIEWVESGSEQGGYWRHILTQQRVCPTPQRQVGDETYHPSPTHTFAEPA